ncbi:MAG: DUF1761 domain-containing protein [Rhodospirillales bacterium]|nr:DUF1761 domain-containing protein [Rhodospirillales bacterium]
MVLNYFAILVAAVASWIAGAVWYGVLGKQWMVALGWNPADAPKSMPVGPMITSFVAELVMALMLAGLIGHFGQAGVGIGVITGALCWLGFVVTTIAVNNAFQKRTIKLTVIDSGHWLVVLLV